MAQPRARACFKSPGELWPPQVPKKTASFCHTKPAQPLWVTAARCHLLRARILVSPQPVLEPERRCGVVWSRKTRIVRPLQKACCSLGAKLLPRLAWRHRDRHEAHPLLAPALPAGRFWMEQQLRGQLQGSGRPRRSSRLRGGAAPEGEAAFPEGVEVKFVLSSLRGALGNPAKSRTRLWWKGKVAAPLPATPMFWGSPQELVTATASPSTVRPGQGTPNQTARPWLPAQPQLLLPLSRTLPGVQMRVPLAAFSGKMSGEQSCAPLGSPASEELPQS